MPRQQSPSPPPQTLQRNKNDCWIVARGRHLGLVVGDLRNAAPELIRVHEKLSSAIVDLQLYEVADRDKVELAHEFLSGKHVEISPILVRAGDSLRCRVKTQ
jgi:hypothetical protein